MSQQKIAPRVIAPIRIGDRMLTVQDMSRCATIEQAMLNALQSEWQSRLCDVAVIDKTTNVIPYRETAIRRALNGEPILG
jgi:hypothetical protein